MINVRGKKNCALGKYQKRSTVLRDFLGGGGVDNRVKLEKVDLV